MIPKIVHYIWLGSEIPPKTQDLINKNNEFFKDYKVKIWTEENIPKLNVFAQRAYNEKKWAFVSDYLRFHILYEEGGIYLDTDMEVLNPLDDLLDSLFFAGWDRRNAFVYAGIVGVEPKNEYIKNIVDSYDNIADQLYPTSPEIMTECYKKYDEKETLLILDSQYFYPLLDGEKPTRELLEYAYTNHLWYESWRSYVPLRRVLRRLGLIKVYHYIINIIKK